MTIVSNIHQDNTEQNWKQPGVLSKKRILVAEDDHTNFYLLKEYLNSSEAEVIWTQNGKEVVAKSSELDNVDIIIMDIQMPEMSGYDAMQIIKSQRPDVPIIALTAYAMFGDREKGLAAGFNEYLSKPVSRKVLMETILQFLS